MKTTIQPLWHDSPQAAGRLAVTPQPRVRKVLLVAMLFVVMLSTTAGLLTWLLGQPNVHFVSCWVTQFRDATIGPNPAAERDRLAIEQGQYFTQTHVASVPIHSRFLMQQQLAAVREHDSSESVVLYVSTYASVDSQGRIMLLSSDFEAGRPDSGLPLAVVLEALAESPASHKLLVLDIFATCYKPGLDAVAVNVAAGLEQELKATPDANRLVLCSCSPGQSALASETLRRTIFGYYFEQALLGAADGYNPRGTRDGRVSVFETAAMLRARVDRWAMQNRARRQIPRLLGTGEDFELTTCGKHPRALPAKRDKKVVPKYPSWLLAGWKLRERWKQERIHRRAPRIFQTLEASLLRIEYKWRYGVRSDNLEHQCAERLDDLKEDADRAIQQLAGPDATSLAAFAAAGHKPDEQAVQAVRYVLQAMTALAAGKPAERQAAFQKQLAKFDKQTEKIGNPEIALAVLQVAVAGMPLTSDSLQTLAELLRHRQVSDQWIETRAIDRLAAQASIDHEHPSLISRANQLLRIIQRREEVFCNYQTLPWMSPLMDDMAQACHDADVYYWKQRYVPSTLVDQTLVRADELCDRTVAHGMLLRGAYLAYYQAMQTLPSSAQYVQRYPAGVADWQSAVDAAVLLAETLESATSATRSAASKQGGLACSATTDSEKPVELSRPQMDAIQTARSSITDTMRMLRQPFSSRAVQKVIGRCRAEDARPEIFGEIDALLATPLLLSEDRAALWTARATLAHRLHERIMRWDYQEQIAGRRTKALSGYDADAQMSAETSLANLRYRVSCGLLRLGGVPIPTSLQLPDNHRRLSPTQLAGISNLWSLKLRELIEDAHSSARQKRMCWIFPPLQPLPLLDRAQTNPSIQSVASQQKTLWSWLANWYRYETLDGTDPEFYARLAVQYAPFVQGPSPVSLQVDGATDLAPNSSPANVRAPQESECQISWTVNSVSDQRSPARVDILNPAAPWLSIRPQQDINRNSVSSPLRLAVSLESDARFEGAVPRGFLIRWWIEGRSFHRTVEVPVLADQCNLEVLLSSNPKTADPALRQVVLRPHTAAEPLYLFVENRGADSRTINVQLNTGAVTAKPLKVAAGTSVRVSFSPSSPSESNGGATNGGTDKAELPELDGPLQVIVTDADQGREVHRQTFPVQLLSPTQYVDVRSVRFDPDCDNRNELEIQLRQVGKIPGGPCEVSLELSADDIPGLLGMGDGVLAGTLPADGEPLRLFARNLLLSDSICDQGQFSVTVDGMPRTFVFDTTFARGGDPTTPIEAIRPTLEVVAPRCGISGGPFVVEIQSNYAPANAYLEILIGRAVSDGSVSWQRRTRVPQARDRRIGFSPTGKGGALLFDAMIGDWKIPLDTTGLIGHRMLYVRLLDSKERELAVAQQKIVLGNQPPQGVQFVDLPGKAWNGSALELAATALQSVPEVSDVVFFLGQPVDNAIPKNAVTVKATKVADGSRWTAQLPLKASDKGKTPVSVQFSNAAGLSSFATTTVDLVETRIGSSTISGRVVEGAVPQRGLDVVLKDAQASVKGKTKTAVDGSFLFQDLPPGDYEMSTTKPSSGRHGSAEVTLPDNTTIQVQLELWL